MTPEEALALAKAVSDIYAQAVADLLTTIAKATARGLDRPDWAQRQLAAVLPLRREAQRIVTRMQAAGPAEVQRLLGEVYAAQTGLTPAAAVNHPTVVALAADTIGRLHSLGPPVLRQVEDIHRRVIADTVASAASGAQTRHQAAAAALDRYAKAGIGGFTDSAGRRWSIDTYTDMATRTALGRAHLAGTLDTYTQAGVEHVIVSDSPEECQHCRPYEGKVLSLGADVAPPDLGGFTYAGTLDQARTRGLFHPDCTHRVNRFVPGFSRPFERPTANPEGYELRQRQRLLERRVRESKRRVAAAEPFGKTPELARQRALLRDRQDALTGFNTAHGRKDWVSARRTAQPTGVPDATPAAVRLARPHVDRLVRSAARAEPAVTDTMQQLAVRHGGTLERLEFRLKTRDSLERKLVTEILTGIDPAAAAAGIKDALRYTVRLDEHSYADGVARWEHALAARGLTVVKRPSGWRPAGQYQGLNYAVSTPDGMVFEVQFHTPASLAAAEEAHRLYEKARLPTTSAEERRLLEARMATLFKRVPLPSGLTRIG